jgi:hypothetical protein
MTVAPMPPPHEPFVDPKTGLVNEVWYRFLGQTAGTTVSVIPVSGGGTGQSSADEAIGELTQALTIVTSVDIANDYVPFYRNVVDSGRRVAAGRFMITTGGALDASTGATELSMSSIPLAVFRVTLMFLGVGVSSVGQIHLQLATTDGVPVTTGYTAAAGVISSTTSNSAAATSGFRFQTESSLNALHGEVRLSRATGSTINSWFASYIMGDGLGRTYCGGGSVQLHNNLGGIRLITNATATNVFDKGSFAITWEF